MSADCCDHGGTFEGLSADYKRRLRLVIAINASMFLVDNPAIASSGLSDAYSAPDKSRQMEIIKARRAHFLLPDAAGLTEHAGKLFLDNGVTGPLFPRVSLENPPPHHYC